ncbi:MAG: hypothetical protein ABW133_08335 [Polyangiaceae bacterium]
MKLGPLTPTSTFGLGSDVKTEEARAKETLAKAEGGSKVDAKNAIDPEKLRLAREFEQIFIRKMLSSLEKAGQKDGAPAGGSAYGGMVVSALAEAVSNGGGVGLADVIARAASQQGVAGPAAPSTADLQAAVAKATTDTHIQAAGADLARIAPSENARPTVSHSPPSATYSRPTPVTKINDDK